ncbi:hypothetical protein CEQ90_02755 [Lewinellaceae bacterium SD302]|nr:hypothetical protein CEQ90_02755 [Lewinellaceae bacterium SD302]
MRLLTLCLLLTATSGLFAQESAGVVFQEKTFDELLTQAKAEDKLIFIDAYTTWCGPCKMMTAKVFPQDKVGQVYNEKFINAKFDMEQGEGPGLAQRYNVRAYPTYLFVNGDGEIIHKGLGYIPADELLALADVATGDENMFAYGERYSAGERDAEFVASYIDLLTDVYEQERANEVVEAYLQGVDKSEWNSPAILQMILANPGKMDGDRFAYMLENADAFKKAGSTAQFISGLQNIMFQAYNEKSPSRQMPDKAVMNTFYAEHAGDLAPQLEANYAMIFAQRTGGEDYADLAVNYYNRYPSNDAMELNGVAWNFYENVEDPNKLKSALGWAMESVRLNKLYMNMDTLAWLYQKMGMTDKAKETATEAIEMAKASGEDYESTLPILEK